MRFIRNNYNAILMAAFLVACALEAVIQFMRYGLGFKPADPAMQDILAVVAPAYAGTMLVLYFMIFTSSLRDEYVEKLWQQAARSFGLLVLIIPWLWLLFGLSTTLLDLDWHPINPMQSILPASVWDEEGFSGIAHYQMHGINFVLGALWTFGPLAFVALFKWHSWRD